MNHILTFTANVHPAHEGMLTEDDNHATEVLVEIDALTREEAALALGHALGVLVRTSQHTHG